VRRVDDGEAELTGVVDGVGAPRQRKRQYFGLGSNSGSGEALGPSYGKRGGVRWFGIDKVAENRGERDGAGLPEADTALVQTRCRGWHPFIAVYCVEATQAVP
jgi:hypothetical protein